MSESLHLDELTLEATRFGEDFVLLRRVTSPSAESHGAESHGEGASGGSLPAVGQLLLESKLPFVDEVIATEVEICLKLNDRFQANSLATLQELSLSEQVTSQNADRPLRLPVWFSDSDDWASVSEQTKLTQEAYLDQLLGCRLQVAMIGFLPGFVYLGGLPAKLRVPRKTNPDKRTAAGAFAIGGKYAGVYSLPSPAGWNVIGHLGIELLQTETLPPMQLQPGDAIRLEQIDRQEYEQLVRTRPTLTEYNATRGRSEATE